MSMAQAVKEMSPAELEQFKSRVQARLPVRLVTVILAGEALQLRQSDSNLVLSRDASQVYQVSLAVQTERASS